MSTNETPCISCGTPWTSHKGIISLCAEHAELKRLYAELVLKCAAAEDKNVAYRLQIQDKANENMAYTEKQLKQALAKMLPETLHWRPRRNAGSYRKSVSDTELLHVCQLMEETLTPDEWNKFKNTFEDFSSWCVFPTNFMHATWQQRVVVLAKVKEIEI